MSHPSAIAELSKRCPDSRDITSGFSRQQSVQLKEIRCAAAVNGALDRQLASVVSSKYQRPVPKLCIQCSQITGRSTSGLGGIQSFVPLCSDGQTIATRSVRH